MKILIVPSWYAGINDELGLGGIFHYEQAIELAKSNTVAVYYMFDRYLQDDFYCQEERGIVTYRSKFIQSQRLYNRIRIYKAFRKIIQEFKPDIVHAHVATDAGRYTALWCTHFQVPFLITEHSTVEVTGVGHGLAHQYAKFVYSRSKVNFCVSEDLRNKLSIIFPKYDFRVMYNGIIMPDKIEQKQIYRKENLYNIGIVASLYDKNIKGMQYLLPALQRLLHDGQKIFLHVVGGGEYEDFYLKMAVQLGIEKHIHFYGECSKQEVYEIVNQMDFFVSASIIESFGCAIAEALLLGKPVVATKCGGPEGFVTSKDGILVEKESAEALYHGIQYMIGHLEQYDSVAIRKYARERFDNSIICRRYEKVYQAIK